MATVKTRYTHQEYPKLVRGPDGKKVKVYDDLQEAEVLGAETEEPEVFEPEEDEYTQLLAEAAELGLEVEEDITIKQLRRAIKKARE